MATSSGSKGKPEDLPTTSPRSFTAVRQLAGTGSRGPGPLVRRAVGVSPDRLLMQTQACHIRWSSPCHVPEVVGAKKSSRRQPCLPGLQQVRLPTKSLSETLWAASAHGAVGLAIISCGPLTAQCFRIEQISWMPVSQSFPSQSVFFGHSSAYCALSGRASGHER